MDESANHIASRASQPGAAGRTRDLPARTVQDHGTDQRPHPSILEGIRKHLEELESLVREVRQDQLPGLSRQLAIQTDGLLRELADGRQSAPAWAESLGEQIRAVSAQINPIAELPALWTGLATKLTGTDGKVGALANRIDRLDDHIGDTDDRVGLISERIGSLNDRIGSIDGHMAIVNERTAPIDGRLGALETKLIEAAGGRITAADGDVTGIDGTIKAFGERLSGTVAPFADELRLRPAHTEVEEIVTKVVAAAEAATAARLDSLEEAVLTLAEALLRPAPRRPDQRRGDDLS